MLKLNPNSLSPGCANAKVELKEGQVKSRCLPYKIKQLAVHAKVSIADADSYCAHVNAAGRASELKRVPAAASQYLA